MNKKSNKSRIIAIALIVGVIAAFAIYSIGKKQEANVVESTIDTLTSALDNNDEKYMLLEVIHEESSYEYYLQFYEDGTSYFVSKTVDSDNEFTFSSVCNDNVEYVSSEFTNGFEILNTDNCSNKSYNINSDFAMLDLSILSSEDFDVSSEGETTTLTMDEDALNTKDLLANYTSDSDISINALTIVSENSKTTLLIDFNHSLYGKSEIRLTVEPTILIELPEYN